MNASQDRYDIYEGRDTAVARLHRVVVQLLRFDRSEVSVLRAWASVYGRDVDDKSVGFHGRELTARLAVDARQEVESLGRIKSRMLLERWPNITALLELDNLGAPMRNHLGYLAEPLPSLLLKAHEDLFELGPHQIRSTRIEPLRKRFEELLADIARATDLDPLLRRVLTDIVRAALHALTDFAATGASGLEDALRYGRGAYQQHQSLIDANAEQPLVQRTVAASGRMARIIQWANANNTIIQIGLGVTGLLLSGTQVALAVPAVTRLLTQRLTRRSDADRRQARQPLRRVLAQVLI